MNKNLFEEINSTINNEVVSDYLYYDEVKYKHPKVDFSVYVETNNDGIKIISINNYHRCLLENDEEYKEFVIDEVLYDIDKFGYYGNNEFEYNLDNICSLMESELTPDDIGSEQWDALSYLSDVTYSKHKTKTRKRKNKH